MTGREAPPYFAQWESPELIGAIVRCELRARDDPRWRASGASTPEEYEWWARRLCGVACLRMVLAWRGIDPPPMLALARALTDAGGYRHRPDGGLDGLIYRPFVDYLGRAWGISAGVAAPLEVAELDDVLAGGAAVMASVSPAIRDPGATPAHRGGHLVLVYDQVGDRLVLHNPSGDRASSQRGAAVPRDQFAACFAGRGVVIHPAGG